jgi:hypothetical protein
MYMPHLHEMCLHEYNKRKRVKERELDLILHHVPIGILILEYIKSRNGDIVMDVLSVAAGLYTSDALSGALHLFFDHYTGSLPVLREEARIFQDHHIPPYKINESRVSIALHNTIIIVPPLLAAYINYKHELPSHVVLYEIVTIYGLYMSDFVHGLCHDKRSNQIVKWLRKQNLLIRRRTHKLHHETLNSNYCMVNGWANPLVNSLSSLL